MTNLGTGAAWSAYSAPTSPHPGRGNPEQLLPKRLPPGIPDPHTLSGEQFVPDTLTDTNATVLRTSSGFDSLEINDSRRPGGLLSRRDLAYNSAILDCHLLSRTDPRPLSSRLTSPKQ